VGFAALFQAVAALVAQPAPPPALPHLTAREKAALVVVSGLPAPRGVAGVIVQRYTLHEPRPKGALAFVDQEGGSASTFASLPPGVPASSFSSRWAAFRAGRATGRALRRAGVEVDLAPVLDLRGGPLGSRHFARPTFGVAFARGLRAAGEGACVKHYPGLGTARISTDESPNVWAKVVPREEGAFREAVRAGIPCVMVGHAYYPRFGKHRASFSPLAYRRLRATGFDGVVITDSLSVFGSRYALLAARSAARAGADLLLFTGGRDAANAIRALLPLARRGALDDNVARVLELRRALGLGHP
jgi:beta-glucosidase-like glycosyl hydrolase